MHRCKITNASGQTLYVKIIGMLPGTNYWPQIPQMGPQGEGLIFDGDSDYHDLIGGQRAVIAWDNQGNLISMAVIDLQGPSSIEISGAAGATIRYATTTPTGAAYNL